MIKKIAPNCRLSSYQRVQARILTNAQITLQKTDLSDPESMGRAWQELTSTFYNASVAETSAVTALMKRDKWLARLADAGESI